MPTLPPLGQGSDSLVLDSVDDDGDQDFDDEGGDNDDVGPRQWRI